MLFVRGIVDKTRFLAEPGFFVGSKVQNDIAFSMNEPFTITTTYKGIQRDFEASLQIRGYTHRFVVVVDGTELYFERDEEGCFRAIVSEHTAKQIDPALLQAIAHAIEAILA